MVMQSTEADMYALMRRVESGALAAPNILSVARMNVTTHTIVSRRKIRKKSTASGTKECLKNAHNWRELSQEFGIELVFVCGDMLS